MEPNYNAADAQEEDADSHCYATILQFWPSLPVQIGFRVPFSQTHVRIGQDSLGRLRKQARLRQDANARLTLAAHLLSQEPVSPVHAKEAAEQARFALGLMPPDEEIGDKAQWKAMTHKLLGDALIVLGERAKARYHWRRAVALDPVRPPYGFSGPAQEMLKKYPLKAERGDKSLSLRERPPGGQ